MPTSSFSKFNQFSEDLAKKVHSLSADSFVVALLAAANAPSASLDAVLADVTQISYTNCSSRALTVSSCEQTSGVLNWVVNDLTLTASGGAIAAFRYAVIYNDTPTSPADPLIGWYDYGADVTLADGESLLLNFDNVNGIFDIT